LSFETKRRGVVVLLAVMLLWPLLHHVLVQQVELWPWKFYGWSMYCTETGSHTLVVVEDASGRHVLDPFQHGSELEGRFRGFRGRRNTYGALVAPDQLAQHILASRPDVRKVDVFVQHYGLDAGSGRLEAGRRYRYAYPRGGSSSSSRRRSSDTVGTPKRVSSTPPSAFVTRLAGRADALSRPATQSLTSCRASGDSGPSNS
jgi:hypothetical protein